MSLQIKISTWVLIFLLCTTWQLQASNKIILHVSGSNKLTVNGNSINRLQVSNTLNSFNTLLLNTDKGEFVELLIDSYSKSNLAGAPQLPVLSRMIEVPAGSTPIVKVISYDVNEYNLSDFGITQKLFPAQPPQAKNNNQVQPLVFNKQLYETNKFYGEALARVEIAGYMRSVQLANMILSPVEYNPVSNSIRVYDNLVVEVLFSGALKAKSAENNARTQSPYFKNVQSNLLNYQPDESVPDFLSGVPVKYVIVSDPMFREALQPFIRWKTKRGFNVISTYTNNPEVGKTNQSIKAYLQNLYLSATSSDPAPTFVLFVGDVDQIPSYNCGSHVSDLYYCEYTGDYLPEVYYGRFSANTVAELLPQINKTLEYEQYLMPDPSFLGEVVLAAGADESHQVRWGNGQINYATQNYFNEAHGLFAHTYLQPEPSVGNYSQYIQANINHGVSYANYTAHGDEEGWANPLFTISDIAKLQNAGKYGLIVGNSCQTNAFNLNSFGEALVRAENKGALGYIGATDLTYWNEDYWWGVGNGSVVTNPTYETTGLGVYDRVFHDHGEARSEWYSTMGQMVFAGNLAVQESNSDMKKYYWEIYCLMGDPSTMVYFSVPPAMTASYKPLIPTGTSSFQIQTEPFAYVAISVKNKLYGVSEADENGLAVVSSQPFTEPGYAAIVITMQNRQPYIDSVLVATPEGPYLLLDKYTIHDKGGNNNKLPESGEILTVDISLNNVGISDATNAKSILTTNDKYLTIPENTHTWPLIAGNESAAEMNAFTIQVKDNIPDMHKASVVITTQADTSTFSDEFSFLVYAPQLRNGNITFSDTAGNGNGQIDPGEKIYISILTTNTGHCTSAEVMTHLFVAGENITSNSPAINLGSLIPGTTVNSVFSFMVSPYALPGSSFSLFVSAVAGPHNSVSSLNLVIGPQVEDYETGDFTKFNWQMKGNKSWEISSAEKSQGSYGAKSGAINNSEHSEMSITGQVPCSDTISFYYKVSSEWGYDFLKFYMDGKELGRWSGSIGWTKVSYPVMEGDHCFSWVYEKDEATVSRQDAAWIDFIQLPAFNEVPDGKLSVTTFAEPATICTGDKIQLYAFLPGGSETNSYQWSPSGSISDSGIFNPYASPNETTTYTVQVAGKSSSVMGQVTVNVERMPDTPLAAIVDDHLISTAAEGNQWYNSNGIIAGANEQEYYPAESGTYYVIANNQEGCPSSASNEVEFVFTGVKPSVENNFLVYPNPFKDKFYIEYTTKTAGLVWIELYNSMGNEAGIIDKGMQLAGEHKAVFDGSQLAAGIYTCKVFNGDFIQYARLIKIK
jgi:hypothetical protein